MGACVGPTPSPVTGTAHTVEGFSSQRLLAHSTHNTNLTSSTRDYTLTRPREGPTARAHGCERTAVGYYLEELPKRRAFMLLDCVPSK